MNLDNLLFWFSETNIFHIHFMGNGKDKHQPKDVHNSQGIKKYKYEEK